VVRNLRFILLPLLLMLAFPAAAAVFVEMPFLELVQRSDRIVRGYVIETKSYFLGTSGRIVTDVTVEVAEDIAQVGSADEARSHQVQFTTLGGVVGDQGQMVAGLSSYRAGDELVLFLGKTVSNTGVEKRPVIGVALGSFFVTHRDGQAILKSAVIGRANDAPTTLPDLIHKVRLLKKQVVP